MPSSDTYPKFYHFPGSCSQAIHILLLETNLPYTPISISARPAFPPSFLSINPKAKIPVLQLDPNTTITEAPAIMTWISQQAPTKNLMGATPMDTVRVYEWLNFLSGTVHAQSFGPIFRPERFSAEEGDHGRIRAAAVKALEKHFEFIEGKLEGKKYALGEYFTGVDGYLVVIYRWAYEHVKMDVERLYPNFHRVVQTIAEREAVRKAMEREGLTLTGEL
jgi:glutathione S-transferase